MFPELFFHSPCLIVQLFSLVAVGIVPIAGWYDILFCFFASLDSYLLFGIINHSIATKKPFSGNLIFSSETSISVTFFPFLAIPIIFSS